MNMHPVENSPHQFVLTSSARQSSPSYIPGIDGLRALAIIAVMLYHLEPSLLPGGFSGVDVFFVISGFVVSKSLVRDREKALGGFILGFYARRMVRILPALVVCLLVTSLATNLVIPDSWLSNTNRDTALYAFFGLSNFILAWTSDGYFSPKVEFNPFTHTWSLAIEEQFYLLFPILFFIWLRVQDTPSRLARNVGNNLVIALLVISLAYSAVTTIHDPLSAYYLLPSRFWELACGAWLFQLQSKGVAIPASIRSANLTLLAGFILIVAAFIFSDPHAFPFPWSLLSTAGSALMIAGVSSPSASGNALEKLLNNRLMIYIGAISYSLYLWHWPVNAILRWTFGLDHFLEMASAVMITILLASLSFRLIEQPVRKHPLIRALPRPATVLGGGLLIATSWAMAGAVFQQHHQISLSVTQSGADWYPSGQTRKTDVDNTTPCDSEWQTMTHKSLDVPVEIELFKSRHCHVPFSPTHRLFIFGDSHASAYSAMALELTKNQPSEVWIYSKGGCGVANLIEPRSTDIKCNEFIESSAADIARNAKQGDVLLLASLRMNRFGNQWGSYPEAEIKEARQGARAAHDRALALTEAGHILDILGAAGLKIIIDAPKPVFRVPPFRCSDWFNATNPVCEPGFSVKRDELLQYRQPVLDSIAILQINHPDLLVWDPFPALCPGVTCSTFDNAHRPLYFDGDHLSAHGNRVIFPSFLALLDGIWGHL